MPFSKKSSLHSWRIQLDTVAHCRLLSTDSNITAVKKCVISIDSCFFELKKTTPIMFFQSASCLLCISVIASCKSTFSLPKAFRLSTIHQNTCLYCWLFTTKGHNNPVVKAHKLPPFLLHDDASSFFNNYTHAATTYH